MLSDQGVFFIAEICDGHCLINIKGINVNKLQTRYYCSKKIHNTTVTTERAGVRAG